MRKLSLKLTLRSDGRVAKRINGVYRTWRNAEIARAELIAMMAVAERNPAAIAADATAAPRDDVSVRDVFNAFLLDRESKLTAGAIEGGTFLDYKDACESFCAALESWRPKTPDAVSIMGRNVPIVAVCPIHFAHSRQSWGKTLGPFALSRRIQGVRTAFKWAVEINRSLARYPHYADQFSKPTKTDERRAKRQRQADAGEGRFTPDDLRIIFTGGGAAIDAMSLLGLNGGMYAADCAVLRFSDIKRERRLTVIDTYREKTQVRHKFVLWPETIAAIQAWKSVRPQPRAGVDPDLVFITHHGRPWMSESVRRDDDGKIIGGGETNSIALMFNRFLNERGIKRPGVGFGKFRHTHVTAAARCPDVNARKVVRGHKIDGIEASYDFHDVDRLKSVTDVVRSALLLPAIKRKSAAHTAWRVAPPGKHGRRAGGRRLVSRRA